MRLYTLIVLSFILFLPLFTFSQCAFPVDIEYLHVNNIRAAILNQGDNFWNRDEARFQVPYNGPSSPSAIFASNLWIGVKNPDDELLLIAGTFNGHGSCGWYPGPIVEGEKISDPDRSNLWNKIFTVHGQDIIDHIEDAADGRIDIERPSIYGWPGHGNSHFEKYHGMPVIDDQQGMADFHEVTNHENGIYEPEFGEYPHVSGMTPDIIPGAIFWTVYNSGGQGAIDGVAPILEMQQTAWAMACDDEVLSNTIFIRYKLINRDVVDYSGLKFGLWMESDLGCFRDDYMGSSPENDAFYIYNEDNEDDTDCFVTPGYGINPPVQVTKFLNQSLDGFSVYFNAGIPNTPQHMADPNTYSEYYNYLSSRWADGTPFSFGGSGYDPSSKDTTKYMFSDPPSLGSGWSMFTENVGPHDIRTVATNSSELSNGQLEAGHIISYDMAFSYFREDGLNHIENVDYALSQLPDLQSIYDSGFANCNFPSSDCNGVWPGDTDNNGRVDYLDAVNIFKTIGEDGEARTGSFAWLGTEVPDWNHRILGSKNAKHSDINGDGIIAKNEILYITDFIGNTNSCEIPKTISCPRGDEVFVEYLGDSIFGTGIPLDPAMIFLRSKNHLWGYSYRLKYDNAIFNIRNFTSELEWEEDTVQTLAFSIQENEEGTGSLNIVNFNDQKMDRALSEPSKNTIAKIFIHQLDVPSTYHQPYGEIEICDFIVYYHDGSTAQLPTKSIKYWMPDSVVITSNRITNKPHSLSIYPNPSIGHFTLDWIGETASLTVHNAHGQLIDRIQITNGLNEIDLSTHGPGLFFLKALQEDQSYVGRIVMIE